jgi:hypothetical protein
MAASFLEPRGIRLISAKYFHTSGGCSPSIAVGMTSPYDEKRPAVSTQLTANPLAAVR